MQKTDMSEQQIQRRRRNFLKSRAKSSGKESPMSSESSIKTYRQQQQQQQKQKQQKQQKKPTKKGPLDCMPGWQQYDDQQVGTSYYYHPETGISQWRCPQTQKQQQQVLRKYKKK